MSRTVRLAAVSATAAFLALLVVWPLAAILIRNLADVGPDRFVDIVTRRSLLDVAWFTLWQAGLSAVLTVIIGLPIAHVVARYRFPGRTALRAMAVVPFVLPTVVVAAAFQSMADRIGVSATRSVAAVIAAHVFFNVAIVVRIVGGFWATFDQRLVEAARVLGASPWVAFRRVTVPRLLPSVTAAALLSFLFSFTSFGVILILGGPRRATLETEIYRFAVSRGEFDVAAVLAVVQITVVAACAVASGRVERHTTVRAAGLGRPLPLDTAGRRLHVGFVLVLVLVVIVAPLGALVERSVQVGDGYGIAHYRGLLDPVSLLPVSPARALLTSVVLAIGAATVAAVVGLLGAIAIAGRSRVGRLLEVASLIPLGVSAVTLGFGYLITFTFLDLRSSPWLVPLAHAVIGMPFVLGSVVPALRSIDDRLRQAASTLGASPWAVARQIDWPLIRRPLLAGAAFAAAISVGEFGATSFLARGSSSFTAPLAIFRLLSQPGDVLQGQAVALSVLVGLVVATLAAVIERRRGFDGGAL